MNPTLFRISSSLNRICNAYLNQFNLHFKPFSSMIFDGKVDRYNGIHVSLKETVLNEQQFESNLEESLTLWSTKHRASWFQVGIQNSKFIPILVQKGYLYHHAKPDQVTMCKWLRQSEPVSIPSYAFTNIGVGGLVVDNQDRVLVVKERQFMEKQMWKFPGGYAVQGEEFGETAEREVREETGIKCSFESVVTLRHFHKFAFDCSDIYIVVHLKPIMDTENKTLDVNKCDHEIAECKWIPIDELMPQLSRFNKYVLNKFLDNRNSGVKIGMEKVDSVVKGLIQSVYSIHS